MKRNILVGIVALLVGIGIGKIIQPSNDAIPMQMSSGEVMEHPATENFKGKTKEELEIAFLENMIPHHESAIVMANELKRSTKRPELVKLADDIISTQTSEISLMKGWLNQWFGR